MRTALLSFIALGIGVIIGSAALPRANAADAGGYTVIDPSEVVTTTFTDQPGTTYIHDLRRVEVDLDAYMLDECKWNPVTITITADRSKGQISCATASGTRIKATALPITFMWSELAIVWQKQN